MSGQPDTGWGEQVRAERRLLGILMLNPRAAHHVLSTDALARETLSFGSHRIVFDAIRRLHAAELPVDVLTVEHDLRCRGMLTAAGGPDTIDRLAAEVPRAADLGATLKAIRPTGA